MRSLEDLIEDHKLNSGTEGGHPGHTAAFPGGQEVFDDIAKMKGVRGETYYAALGHIRKQTRENGIDAALSYKDATPGEIVPLDALLFCDQLMW